MPLSEGFGGLRPSRLAERIEEQDGRRAHLFLLRLVELLAGALAFSLVAILVLLVLFVFYIGSRDARRDEVDDKIARVECIALRALDPKSPLAGDLRTDLGKLGRSCADVHLRLVPTPSPSTTTATVTKRPPKAIGGDLGIPAAPGASSTEAPEPRLSRTRTPAGPSRSRSAPRTTTPPPPSSTSPRPGPSPTRRPIVEISIPGLIGLRVG